MALIVNQTLAADGNVDFDWKPHRREVPLRATIFVYGDFGSGGTATLQASPDGGTTYIDVPDATGAATAFTANGMANFELYANGDVIAANRVNIRIALAGSTSPDLDIRIFDDV